MFNNIIFVGGIHGVGKSTVCKLLSKKLNIEYISASDVLKWKDLKEDYMDKNVADISDTQSKLITNLSKVLDPNKYYLLDGHLCLFNSKSEVERVPLDTFEKINPILLCVVTGNINDVAKRLSERDGKEYDVDKLSFFQDEEKRYGDSIAKYLRISYLAITNSDSNQLEQAILKVKQC